MSVKVITFRVQPNQQLVRHDLGSKDIVAQVRKPNGTVIVTDMNTKVDLNYVLVGIDDSFSEADEMELVISY